MIRAIVVGAGGHAAVVLEAALAMRRFEIVGLLDPAPEASEVLGYRVLGGDQLLASLYADGVTTVLLGLGSNSLRSGIAERALSLGYELPPVVHPGALVSGSAVLEEGVVVMARAVVGTRAHVRRFAIINTAASIDHDADIGEASHIAPGVTLAGCITVGARSLVGTGSAVRPLVTIGDDAVVGAGSAVVSDIPSGRTAYGVPAKVCAA